MFRIDGSKNRITKLKEVRFSELGFNERGHLQEWLANQPDALERVNTNAQSFHDEGEDDKAGKENVQFVEA